MPKKSLCVSALMKVVHCLILNTNTSKLRFGRVDYQARSSGVSSFKHLLARLPPRVHSVFYRDQIGNISSSHLRTDYRRVTFLLAIEHLYQEIFPFYLCFSSLVPSLWNLSLYLS